MSQNPKTNELIELLAKDSATTAGENEIRKRGLGFSAFARFWIVGAVLIAALSVWLLPTREDLGDRLTHADSFLLFLLWSAATLFSTFRVYSLAFPDLRLKAPFDRFSKFAGLPLALIALFTIARFTFTDLGFQFFRESSYLNGGCGMVILVAGSLHASILFTWMRRGATTAPFEAGAWAAVSTASLASFIVQFACANENPIHVLLWHFAPLLILTGIAGLAAKRLLRW